MAREVRLPIKTTGADKAANDLGKVDKGLGALAKSAGLAAGAFFGARALIAGFQSVIDKTREQALAEAQLNAVLKSTGGIAGVTSQELTRMASALQKQTRYGDEAIIKTQALLLTFTKVGKDVFPQATETILNMSEAMGQDLKQGAIQVGKALNDPVLGVTALRRVGVQLSAQQEQQIRDFVAVNDIASAQKIILAELETQFGGAAKAAGETMAGSLDKMKNAVGDAQESIGEALSPAIIGVANAFTSAAGAVSGFFKRLTETQLDTTIRELGELGKNTENLQRIRSQRIEFDLRQELIGQKSIEQIKKENLEIEKAMNAEIAKKEDATIKINELEKNNLADNLNPAHLKQLDIITASEQQYMIKLRELEANYELLGQYEQLRIVQEQIAQFQKDSSTAGGEGATSEDEKAKSSNTFMENSKNAAVSLAQAKVQGKDMTEAGKEFDKAIGKALLKLLSQIIIEKAITKEKKNQTAEMRQQAALATAGKIFGFATGGSYINKYPTGGSFDVSKRTILPTNPPAIVGDNASGMERIDITPLPAAPSSRDRNIVINISAPLVDESVVDHIIPAIRRAEKLGL